MSLDDLYSYKVVENVKKEAFSEEGVDEQLLCHLNHSWIRQITDTNQTSSTRIISNNISGTSNSIQVHPLQTHASDPHLNTTTSTSPPAPRLPLVDPPHQQTVPARWTNSQQTPQNSLQQSLNRVSSKNHTNHNALTGQHLSAVVSSHQHQYHQQSRPIQQHLIVHNNHPIYQRHHFHIMSQHSNKPVINVSNNSRLSSHQMHHLNNQHHHQQFPSTQVTIQSGSIAPDPVHTSTDTNLSQQQPVKDSLQPAANSSEQPTEPQHTINEAQLAGSSCNSDDDDNSERVPAMEPYDDYIDLMSDGVDEDEDKETETETDSTNRNDAVNDSEPPIPPVKDRRKVRANVIRELIQSERDYVKHLKDVVEGYLLPARRHPEIFTVLRIKTIFANIEQLYEFQKMFLAHLETCIKWDDLASSQVGHCFLEHENEFSVYHYYCNNHPNASSELLDLLNKPRFVKFFEACSVTLKEQNMINQAIDSLLLTPVQKICRYSLQLNELLKNTDEDHPDYCSVVDALESMRNCANLANERRRRIEALANVMSFQEKFENWFGPKLCDTSSILIHSGEVVKESSHSWPTSVQLFLFTHLLLYCKKDLLKRNNLILKGRIALESVKEITDADEYKPKKSFKLFCDEQKKWFVFTAGSEREKDEWMMAFERERNLVEADENEGFHITEKEIGVAKLELQKRKNQLHHRSTRLRHRRPDTAVVDQLDMNDVTTIMNRTLSLPSCIHPNHVMNFVEDSRLISSSKKKTPENRSPINSSTTLADQENSQHQQHPSPQSTGWFRKMGSKKLAKSQVYIVNGSAGSSSSSTKNRSSSPNFLSEASVTKYNQLEKRHRDHMVGEEQARLLRLNNYTISTSYTMKSETKLPHPIGDQECVNQQLTAPPFASDGLSPARSINTSNFINRTMKESLNFGSNERTVILPTGRIVRVREDEV